MIFLWQSSENTTGCDLVEYQNLHENELDVLFIIRYKYIAYNMIQYGDYIVSVLIGLIVQPFCHEGNILLPIIYVWILREISNGYKFFLSRNMNKNCIHDYALSKVFHSILNINAYAIFSLHYIRTPRIYIRWASKPFVISRWCLYIPF